MSWVNAAASTFEPRVAVEASRYRTSLSPNTRTRPGCRYSWKPASARPVFWMCGTGDRRGRGPPCAAQQFERQAYRLGPALQQAGDGELRLHGAGGYASGSISPRFPSGTAEQDVDRVGRRVAEDEERVVAVRRLRARPRRPTSASPRSAARGRSRTVAPSLAAAPAAAPKPAPRALGPRRRRGRLRRRDALALALGPLALQLAAPGGRSCRRRRRARWRRRGRWPRRGGSARRGRAASCPRAPATSRVVSTTCADTALSLSSRSDRREALLDQLAG